MNGLNLNLNGIHEMHWQELFGVVARLRGLGLSHKALAAAIDRVLAAYRAASRYSF